MATSGDRRDAFQAGKSAASRLTVSERSQTRIRSSGRKIGATYSPPPEAPEAANRYARPIPADIPRVAPIRPMNWTWINQLLAISMMVGSPSRATSPPRIRR
jgi:hypothetical protein